MNRRSFLKNSIFLAGGLAIAHPFLALGENKGKLPVKGRVTSKGRPVPNVPVSDGYNVVQTDAKGYYSLPFQEEAEFVFITTPSGYEFQHQENVAGSYGRIGKQQAYDFELKKLPADDTKHRFLIWADPQIKNKKDAEMLHSQAVPDVLQLVKSFDKNTLVHGIAVGDLIWDEKALWGEYIRAVNRMNIPFFQALGNHDQDYDMGGDEKSDQTFKSHFGPTYYSFNRGKAHYVILDDVRYLGPGRKYDGYILKHQLDWLKKDLALVPKDNLVIICLHIPVHNSVKNNDALYALLQPFKNVHIMSGHTHYNKNVIKNGIYEHNHGTVCGAWWTGPICGDGTPGGYGVYEVNGTDLKWYYKSTGLPEEHQISLDVETLTAQKRLMANVWNWDPEWKVEYEVDGKNMGVLENTIGFDPLAVRLLKGDKLPERRPFAEPKKTDHLFMAHLGPEAKRVKVIATDRFGRKYEESVNA